MGKKAIGTVLKLANAINYLHAEILDYQKDSQDLGQIDESLRAFARSLEEETCIQL